MSTLSLYSGILGDGNAQGGGLAAAGPPGKPRTASGGIPQKPEIKNTPEGQKERELHEELLTAYYRRRDYDLQTGIPTREGLERLGLGYVADALEANPPALPWQGPPLWPLDSYPRGGRRV